MSRSAQVLSLLLSLALASAPVGAQASQRDRDPAAVARGVLAAIDAHDLVRAGTLLRDSFQLHYQGVPDPISKKDFLDMFAGYYAAFPDMNHVVQRVWRSGNHVTLTLVLHATHRGTYEGIPATGKDVAVGAIHVFRVADGKIAEWWAAEDDLGLLRQIGMVIKPPPNAP